MADSYWSGTTPGGTSVFTVPFPYITQSDVQVSLNGVPLLSPGDYTWPNAGSIQFNQNVPAGQTLVIQRATSPDAVEVSFNNGAVLTAADLNTAVLQCFYRTQELQDELNTYIVNGVLRYQVNGTNPATDAQALLNAAADAALSTTIAQELLNGLTNITTNANSILTNTNQISTLQATVDNLTSGIPGGIGTYLTNETNARISGDAALASTFSLMGAVSGDGRTFVLNTANVYTDSVTSMADKLAALTSSIGSNSALIATEQTTRAAGDSANASSISALTTTVNSNSSAITAEQTARANGDSANATSISGLQSTVTTNNNTLNAAIATEQTTRANADSALSTSISAVSATATSKNVTFSQSATPTALAVGDLWLDTGHGNLLKRWSGSAWVALQDSAIATNSANIATEITARANGDSANASSITTLQTTVNGHTSTITTLQSSVNGLDAQYVVRLDSNGYVAGFGLSTGLGSTSNFTILANNFSVIDPGNGATSPIVPFTITGGVVYMQNVVIGNALIESLAVGKLTSGVLTAAIQQNADITVGTGKVIWDNGAYMKVTGVGFGSSNQFISWFGPHLSSFSSCTEANAIAYEKIDGSAYFGGTLLSGVLSNSVQATVLDTTNVADLGQFSSNGGTITVNWSYNFHGEIDYPGTSQGLTNYNAATKESPSAQLILSRSTNGGTFTDVLTINISNGSYNATAPQPADQAPGSYVQNMSGSGTYTDPDHNTNTREYKLRINSWTNMDTTCTTNTLSLHSTE